MNKIERAVDDFDPGLSARLRALKMRWRHDVGLRLIQKMMRPGDVGVDIGANRGVYTHVMSGKVGKRGRVHAVEPFPGNGARLEAIARRRGNIVVHKIAVSDHSGDATLRVPVYDGHQIDALATLEPNQAQGEEDRCVVPVCTLDELLEGERRVSFLKCDVEGHEQRVLLGASAILGRDHPVVFIELEQRHRTDSIDGTFAFFAEAGYRGWYVMDSRLRPLDEFDIARDQLDFLGGGFIPYEMPPGYVFDFLFCPMDLQPSV